ncbi:MAG: HD domain-containing protein [Lachnospiraceae bacterium]|nr:HD domain-containing protein [Lachnospiraceae bacterium]
MNEVIIEDAIEYIKNLFGERGDGHDVKHSLRVYRNALAIAEKEGNCDRETVSLAALLHDADDHKLFENKNNENARIFLESHSVSKEKTDYICEVINSVSFSKNRGRRPETAEGKIVQDADRLDAMGAIGIARTFAYGGANKRSLELSIEHFYDKLLLLKDEMNTESAKEIAEKRHVFLEDFLEEYKNETGE